MHTVPGAFQKLQQLYAEGEALVDEGRFEEAAAKFSEGIAIDDEFRQRYVTLYAQRGFAYHRLGQLEAAIADYTRAIQMEPEINQAQYHFHRGLCHYHLQAPAAAHADFTRSIELYPQHPGPWHFRGKLNVEVFDRWEAGVADLDCLLGMNPNANGFQLRGFAKYQLGDLRGAELDFVQSHALTADPYNDYMLACIALRTGDEAQMYAAMERAAQGEPSFKDDFREDEEFAAYRESPRFRELVG